MNTERKQTTRPSDAAGVHERAPGDGAYEAAVHTLRSDLSRPIGRHDAAVFAAVAGERLGRARWQRWTLLAAPVAAGLATLILWFHAPQPPVVPTAPPRPPAGQGLHVTRAAQATVESPRGADGAPAPGDSIPTPARVVTAAGGEAMLTDAAVATVQIPGDSLVEVASWSQKTAVLELERGEVRSRVRPREQGQRYEVITPYARVWVVGTDFTVRHEPGTATEVIGHEGLVTVETLDGQHLGHVGAGDTLRVAPPRILAESVPATPTEPEPETTPPTSPVPTEAPESTGDETPGAEDASAEVPDAPEPPAVATAAPPTVAPTVAQATAPAGMTGSSDGLTARPAPRPRLRRAEAADSAFPRPRGPRGALFGTAPTTAPPSDVPPTPRPAPAHHGVSGLSFGERTYGGGPAESPAVVPHVVPVPPAPPGPAPPPPPPTIGELLRRARALLADGHERAAIALLEPHEDRSWRLQAALGDAYRLAGRSDDALSAYDTALATVDGPPPAHVLADRATMLRGEKAERAWALYLEQHPRGSAAPRARLALARAATRADDVDDAAEHLERLLDDFPRSPLAARALARLGRIHLDGERWDAAAALFRRFRGAARPSVAEISLVGLVRVSVARGDLPRARRLAAEYHERFPNGRRAAEMRHLEAALGDE